MASTKEFFTRIQHKHDTEANWLKATNFAPLAGEIIVYDKDDTHDYQRIKIGDGTTKINNLPFAPSLDDVVYSSAEEAEIETTPINADTLGGFEPAYFKNATTLNGKTEFELNVANANTIDNLSVQDIINKMYPVGSTYITSTNSNPASYLGGTWSLVDREFKPAYGSSTSNYFTINTTNTTSYTLYFIRSGHSLRIRMNLKNKVVLADSDLELGTINFADLGINSTVYTFTQIPMLSDGGNGYAMINLQGTTGVLSTSDALSPSGHSIAAESSCWLEIPVVCNYTTMIDSFCDKFYWKRTA